MSKKSAKKKKTQPVRAYEPVKNSTPNYDDAGSLSAYALRRGQFLISNLGRTMTTKETYNYADLPVRNYLIEERIYDLLEVIANHGKGKAALVIDFLLRTDKNDFPIKIEFNPSEVKSEKSFSPVHLLHELYMIIRRELYKTVDDMSVYANEHVALTILGYLSILTDTSVPLIERTDNDDFVEFVEDLFVLHAFGAGLSGWLIDFNTVGVYDGEEDLVRDITRSLCGFNEWFVPIKNGRCDVSDEIEEDVL